MKKPQLSNSGFLALAAAKLHAQMRFNLTKGGVFIGAMCAVLWPLAALAHPPADTKPDGAYAEYIANSGVLVVEGDTKILFDPLFHDSYGTFRLPSEAQRAKILAGTPPYDGVDAIFISHAHGDHFSAEDALKWLEAHPEGLLIAPKQAVDNIKSSDNFDNEIWGSDLESRVVSLAMDFGDKEKSLKIKRVIKKDGIEKVFSLKADAVRIPHAGWPERADVQNIVYRVTLGEDTTVMHLGDADPNDDHYAPYEDLWVAQKTDLGFPPYWFYSSEQGRNILTDRLRIAETIGVHVPKEVPPALTKIREEQGLGFFSEPGEWHPIMAHAKHGAHHTPDVNPCREMKFEDIPFVVCSVDPQKYNIDLFLNNADGKRWKQFGKLAERLNAHGRELVFAMNAGMYHKNRNPVGLYIEDFKKYTDANTNDGPGNFHLKPNGVFWITQKDGIKSAGVKESSAFLQDVPEDTVQLATQSGPMLVIDGKLHSRFLENSKSKFRRNGVGVDNDGNVHFVISDALVNFHTFARFFRDGLKTPNALFLDGKVSRVYAPALSRYEPGRALGPIIGVTKPLAGETHDPE